MKIYHYDPVTKVLIGVSEGVKSPIGSEYFVPAHSTAIPPPAPIPENKKPVFQGTHWEFRSVNLQTETPEELLYKELDVLDQIRKTKSEEPILLDGIWFDADSVAQKNIADKLLTLDSREKLGQPLPSNLLIWRDHHNVTHKFETQVEYATFLRRLSIQIEERSTELYIESWIAKDLAKQQFGIK